MYVALRDGVTVTKRCVDALLYFILSLRTLRRIGLKFFPVSVAFIMTHDNCLLPLSRDTIIRSITGGQAWRMISK